ncbi:MAG: helix-turn-helix domain-containing protein [Ruminococcaceae bacterium]|nr:helix-turn-helix domain-containing protein [Oscillospiraceae bacterium]
MKNNTDNFYSTASGFPIRLYSARPDNEGAVPLHRHNELELLLVREGTLRLNFSEDSLELSAGHGVLINSGVMHSLGGSADCVCTYVMFSDEFVAPAGSAISLKYVKPFVLNHTLPYVPLDGRFEWQSKALSAAEEVFALLARYTGAVSHLPYDDLVTSLPESSCWELDVHTLVGEIWSSIYKGLEGAVKSTVLGNEYAARRRTQLMTDFIRDNYREQISLSEIAAAANISKSEAARCFQSCLHISPVAYLLRYRVEVAEQLLQNSSMTIEAVGYECGFSSASYFCRMFQRYTGMTPGSFRKGKNNLHGS